MRLLVDVHCFDYKTTEGVNTYIKGLYSELIKIAPEIDFYFVARDIEKVKSIFGERENLKYIALTSKNKIYRLLFEMPATIKKFNIDAAHYQYTSPIIKNCKTIVTLHDILFVDHPELFPYSYRLVKGRLFKMSAKSANLLLTVSEYSKRQISKCYHISLQDIYVTPNAVSDDFWNIDYQEAKRYVMSQGIDKYILYVSRIEPRKNQIALLKAYVQLELCKQGYQLLFIGRRTLPTDEFDNYYKGLDEEVKSKIHIINQVSYEHLKYWYKAASLFVYPALAEGFGIPPIEAGAVGIPCICSDKTAMKDFSFFENNLIDISDNNLLKERIIANLSNSNVEDYTRISKTIQERYSWKNIAKQYLDILNSDLKAY